MSDFKPILLVEDDLNDIELTLTALTELNLANEILTLRDGAQALDYVFRRGAFETRAPGNPVVILLDIKMPKLTGLDVLRQIRGDEHVRMIPVVMLTSSREERDLLSSYQAGINAYVVKPVGYQAFVNAIKEIGLFWGILNEPPPGSVRRTL